MLGFELFEPDSTLTDLEFLPFFLGFLDGPSLVGTSVLGTEGSCGLGGGAGAEGGAEVGTGIDCPAGATGGGAGERGTGDCARLGAGGGAAPKAGTGAGIDGEGVAGVGSFSFG